MLSFASNESLVDFMIKEGVLHTPSVIDAFRFTDRTVFVPEETASEQYGDYPLPIGGGQTISQPSTVAIMLELLGAQSGDKVLDIGSGSGYTTALLSHIVGENGSVVGIDRVDSLVEYGKKRLEILGIKNAKIEKAGNKLGKPDEHFDRILVSAAAEEFPKSLIYQLNIGGVAVVPVGNNIIRAVKKQGGEADLESIYGFRFVPLIYEE